MWLYILGVEDTRDIGCTGDIETWGHRNIRDIRYRADTGTRDKGNTGDMGEWGTKRDTGYSGYLNMRDIGTQLVRGYRGTLSTQLIWEHREMGDVGGHEGYRQHGNTRDMEHTGRCGMRAYGDHSHKRT